MLFIYIYEEPGSLVGTVIRLSGSIPGTDKICYLLHIDQTGCGAQQSPYSIGTVSSVILAKSGCRVKLTTHCYLVQNLRATKSAPPIPYIPSWRARRQTSSLYIHTYIHAHITFLLPHPSLDTIYIIPTLAPAAFANICT